MNIADIRTDYAREVLDEEHCDTDAIRQFTRWWDEAMASNFQFFPGIDRLTHESEAPLKADAQGAYPVPTPGAWVETLDAFVLNEVDRSPRTDFAVED